MEQLNRVNLIGIVGNVRKVTLTNSSVAHFTVATNYCYKTADGTPVIETTWHNVTAFASKTNNIDTIDKGSRVIVEGRIRNNKYTTSTGEDRYQMEILASKVEILPTDEKLGMQQ